MLFAEIYGSMLFALVLKYKIRVAGRESYLWWNVSPTFAVRVKGEKGKLQSPRNP